jgi:CBS-domain-containing membrane protein
MKPFHKPFVSLSARDLMSPEVITLPEAMSLRTAARLLSQARITGAPVVDEQGRCVGVLSATDFLRWADSSPRRSQAEALVGAPCVCAWEITESEELPEDCIAQYMTADVAAVAPATPVHEVARRMLDADVHRLLVLDCDRRPIGVVTGTDVLAAVAYAAARRQAGAPPV